MKIYYNEKGEETSLCKSVTDMDAFNRICHADGIEPENISIDAKSYFGGMGDMLLSDCTDMQEQEIEDKDFSLARDENGNMYFQYHGYTTLRKVKVRLETVMDLIKAKQTIFYLGLKQ
jgi:hypothetical protein